ncbi:pre-rRNA processing [Pestalotiopsis sp. IQ-011]
MALIGQFLTEVRKFLVSRDGDQLRQWLQVEPPVPDHYHRLAQELRATRSIEKLVEQQLPEENDVPPDSGTAWPGFNAFMVDYLNYWRDVDFDDLLRAHELLMGLTNSCTTALNHPTYGTIMLQTSVALCGSLSKLSMTLNKRPDLTRKLQTIDTSGGDEEEKSIIDKAAEVMQRVFTSCLTDRTSDRLSRPEGKKVGVYTFANITLKLLFACRKTYLAKTIFMNITAKSPPLSFYPAAQRVTYLYYLGRFHFINNHYGHAAQCLEQAYLQTPPAFQRQRELILSYLIPSKMILGYLPSPNLLQRPEAATLAPIFSQLSLAVRTGNYLLFQSTIAANEKWLFRKGLLLTLTFRLRPLLWRSLSRRTFLLTYVATPMDPSKPANKAATLDLSHLLVAATYIQKSLEGYLPTDAAPRPRPPHVNAMFMKAVTSSHAPGADMHSTLAPPPGGPRKLRPNDGLIWGNMAITAEHVEDVVASLVAQGLLHGYVAHSLGRFAIMGAAKKGSPVAAGWPSVAEVIGQSDDDVPGWVKG